MPLFPVVGLIIGVLLYLFDTVSGIFWPPAIVAVCDVVFLAVLTGALHLDGVADAADGLFSHRPPEKALEIMKDSRVGAMGLVSIVCLLTLKGAGLAGIIEQDRWLALVIIPAYARAGILFGIRFLPYGRPQGGIGTDFFKSPLPLSSFGWLLLPLVLSLGLGLRALIINVMFVFTVSSMLMFYKRKLGCITGDMMGAMVEITEMILFLALAATIRF